MESHRLSDIDDEERRRLLAETEAQIRNIGCRFAEERLKAEARMDLARVNVLRHHAEEIAVPRTSGGGDRGMCRLADMYREATGEHGNSAFGCKGGRSW